MTKIEQIDWSKFKQIKPAQPAKTGTRNFKKVTETKKGFIKSYKMADRGLIGEQIANYDHLRSIRNET